MSAFVFYVLLNQDEHFDDEIFLEYLRRLIDQHSSESIVFDLIPVYCQKNDKQQEKVLELLLNADNQQTSPNKQTKQLLLILKLFPQSISIVETHYKTLIARMIQVIQSSVSFISNQKFSNIS